MVQVDQFVSITEAKNKLLDLIRNIKLRHKSWPLLAAVSRPRSC